MIDNTLIEAVVSSILVTFLLTFFFTFIFGCTCGICFNKKCNRRANTPCDITPVVYEDVIPIPSRRLQDQSLTLNQNVAYVPVVASSNP